MLQLGQKVSQKQGRKRPLDMPKRMIERREREGERARDRKVEGEIQRGMCSHSKQSVDQINVFPL